MKLIDILNEVLASNYIKNIETLLKEINWDKFHEFKEIKTNSLVLVELIKNNHNFDGDISATKELQRLKKNAINTIYVLKNLKENQ